MKNQFILNPSHDFVEEVVKEIANKDSYVSIDSDDVNSVMADATNALYLTSKEEKSSDRVQKVIDSIFSNCDVADGYSIRSAENIIMSIEYPKSEEITIDEADILVSEMAKVNESVGIIWGASTIPGDSLRVKILATNLKKAFT